MFRALSGFTLNEPFVEPHVKYVKDQQQYFNARPNMVISGTSGLPGFGEAIKTYSIPYNEGFANPSNEWQETPVEEPDNIFVSLDAGPLGNAASECASGSLDTLIRNKVKTDTIGCGWLYTPPNQNSPYPIVSRGALGDRRGPETAFDPPAYRQWFFDLDAAKKQITIDKCKALKNCKEVDSAVYTGVCGFCTDMNQGIPIDAYGKPLYNGPRTSCSSKSIITSGSQCPVPVVNGPQPKIDRTCEPINGRLSMECLRRNVLTAGCSDKGALAIALNGQQQDIDNLSNANSVMIYNRVSKPPINMSIFRDGATTVNAVLQETRQVMGNTQLAANSAIGAAARDLCLRRGAADKFDMCSDLTDTSTAPFDLVCLQRIFNKMGGTGQGNLYPTSNNLDMYNNMGNIGRVRQYWNTAIANMKSGDYKIQRDGLEKVLGIVPQDMIQRAPYQQGVEVFWFVLVPGDVRRVAGFLRRTIEKNIVQYQPGPSNVPQLGGIQYGSMIQLTDVRVPVDFSVKFQITIDDGFWIAVNQPANFDKTAMNQYNADQPGFFESLWWQGPTAYRSNACTPFTANMPNIMKMYFEDAGGGWSAFTFNPIACSGNPTLDGKYLSLTCEARAPFLTFEVKDTFQELRNPGMFGQFIKLIGLATHTRTDERVNVPGKKGFVRLSSANSCINLENIAFQSWKTVTMAFRFVSMPIKETILNFGCGVLGSTISSSYTIIAVPVRGSTFKIIIEYFYANGIQTIDTGLQLPINTWCLLCVNNRGTGFDFRGDTISGFIANQGRGSIVPANANKQLWGVNATWSPTPGQKFEVCNVFSGMKNYEGWRSGYGSNAQYDVAWIHFFDKFATDNDILRDCKADWVYTQFPSSYNSYDT